MIDSRVGPTKDPISSGDQDTGSDESIVVSPPTLVPALEIRWNTPEMGTHNNKCYNPTVRLLTVGREILEYLGKTESVTTLASVWGASKVETGR